MKIKKILVLGITSCLLLTTPVQAMAAPVNRQTDLEVHDQSDLEMLINIVILEKERFPDIEEEKMKEYLEIQFENTRFSDKAVTDIWNSLTDSEKKLVIRYPFDALKVNTSKNIAINQTELKFGKNGLGDRSDAFRHGIWNAEMTILIGKEKSELFATAHEDKDISGNESDGYPKVEHKEMDLHNNTIGRKLGEQNKNLNESAMSDLIYGEIDKVDTDFVWLHE